MQGGYLLTGETIRDRTLIQPLRPVDLRQGHCGLGAWERVLPNPLPCGIFLQAMYGSMPNQARIQRAESLQPVRVLVAAPGHRPAARGLPGLTGARWRDCGSASHCCPYLV